VRRSTRRALNVVVIVVTFPVIVIVALLSKDNAWTIIDDLMRDSRAVREIERGPMRASSRRRRSR